MATPAFGAGLSNVPYLGNAGNLAYQPGPMTTGAPSEGGNPWSPYFGEPQREFRLNPYAAYGRENYALPDAYKGALPYMTQLILHVIAEEDMWPTRVVLPLRLTESEMEIQWDEYIFNNHLLGPVPEEGVSRLITQQTNERRDHYVRYGLAFILEHGFMRTEKGRTCYKANLEQIRNAVLESMHIGVIEALLKTKQFSHAWTKKYGQASRSGSALRGVLGEEVEMYATIQKNEHGFDLLDSRCKKFMRANGVQPDTWVLPEGALVYLSVARRENNQYLLRGPAGPSTYDSALNGSKVTTIHNNNDCTIFESKAFEIPNAPGPVDPLSRAVTVGEYNVMHDTVSDMLRSVDDYKSFMRDIFVYNEEKDSFSRISLRQALKNCNRFLPESRDMGDNSGRLYWPNEFGQNSGVEDMFLFRPDGYRKVPCNLFGDMEERYLPYGSYSKTAQCLSSRLAAANNDVVRDLKKLWDLCEDWSTGQFVPPTAGALVQKGMASYMGLKTLATTAVPTGAAPAYAALKADLVKYLAAFEKLFLSVKTHFPTSNLVDAAHAPLHSSYGTNDDRERAAFFANGFFKHLAPVWIEQASAYVAAEYNPPALYTTQFGLLDTKKSFHTTHYFKGDFQQLKADLLDLIQTSAAATEQELAYNNSSVDEFLSFATRHAEQLQKNTWLAVFFSAIMVAKAAAIANNYLNDFLFLVHKALRSMAAGKDFAYFKGVACAFFNSAPPGRTNIETIARDTNAANAAQLWEGNVTYEMTAQAASDATAIANAAANITAANPAPNNWRRTIYFMSMGLQSDGRTPKAFGGQVTENGRNNNYCIGFAPAGWVSAPPLLPTQYGALAETTFVGAPDTALVGPTEPHSKRARFGVQIEHNFDGVARGTHLPHDTVSNGAGGGGVAPTVNTSVNMVKKWDVTADETDPAARAFMRAFMHMPITMGSLTKLVDSDVPIPFSFLLFRPHITHNMSTGILCKAGAATGETLVGHADFQLADDVVRKMHYGNFTIYSKSIVYKSDAVMLAENIYATGYVGGNDVTFNTTQSLNTENQNRKSIFVAIIPAPDYSGEEMAHSVPEMMNPIDVTGNFAQSVPHLAMLENELGNSLGKKHYATCDYYSHLYQFNNQSQTYNQAYDYAEQNRFNTMCFQGHQSTFNIHTNLYDLTTVNTGHWGANVYPGVGKVRRGQMKSMMNVSYNTSFGATNNIVSITG